MARTPQMQNASELLNSLALRVAQQTTYPSITHYEPHAKQRIFHEHPSAKIKIFLGGNRSGKTYAGVSEDVMRLIKDTRYMRFDYEEPTRGRVIAVDYDRGVDEILLPYFKQFIPPSKLINGSWEDSYSAYKHKLTLADGATCEFMTYNHMKEQFAGTSRHFIHYDEEPPKHIWSENQARLLDTNGVANITMTPVEGATWIFDDLYDPAREDPERRILVPKSPDVAEVFYTDKNKLLVVEVDMYENPHLKEEAKQQFLGILTEEERNARQAGSFNENSSRIFPYLRRETHVDEDHMTALDYEREGYQIYTSMDHGWNSPTAWLWHAVGPLGNIITFHEIYKNKTTIPQFVEMIDDYEESLGIDRANIIRTGDPAIHQHSGITGTTVQQTYADGGIYIYTESIPKDRAIGINKMQQHLNPRLNGGTSNWIIKPTCPNFFKELKEIQFAKHASSKVAQNSNAKEEVLKKNDHAFDAAKYFATFLPDLTPDSVQARITHKREPVSDYFSVMLRESQRRQQQSDADGWTTHDWS